MTPALIPVICFTHQQSLSLTSAHINTPLIEGSISFILRHSATQAGPFGCFLVPTRLPPLPLPTVKVGQIPGGGGGVLKFKKYLTEFDQLLNFSSHAEQCVSILGVDVIV